MPHKKNLKFAQTSKIMPPTITESKKYATRKFLKKNATN